MLLGVLVLIAAMVGSYLLIVPRVDAAINAQLNGGIAAFLNVLASLLFFVLFFLSSGFLYLTIVSFLSSMLWEKLSFEVEKERTGREVALKHTPSSAIADGLLRGFFALGFALVSMCCGWPLAGIPGVLLAGYVGLHDYTASAFSRRGMLLMDQRQHLRQLPSKGSFVVGAGLLTLFPFVNVLALPALVAAGTLMVIDSERSAKDKYT